MIIARQQANQDAIMDIGGWQRSLGLERYEAVFRENDVDDLRPNPVEPHPQEPVER